MIKLNNILPLNNNKINRLHLLATVLFLALFAFPLFSMHLTNVILMALSALTLVSLLIKPISIKKPILWNLVFVLPFIPYLVELLITGFNPVVRFEFEKKLFFFTAIFIIPVFIEITGFKNYKLALLIFSLSVLMLCLYSFTALFFKGIPFSASSYENGSYILRHNFEKFSGLHSTYYSVFALSSAWFLSYSLFEGKKTLRVACKIMSAILLISVLYLAVRIAFFTLGVFILVSIIESRNAIWRKLLMVLAAIALMGTVSFVVPSLKNRLSEFLTLEVGPTNNDNTIFQRTMIIDSSMKIFSENFWAGTGSEHFQKELNNCYSLNKWKEGAVLNFNPHNQYLSIGINYGIFILILFVACLFVIFRKLFKLPEGKYFCIAIVFFFLTESMLERQMGVYFFGLIAVLLYNIQPFESVSSSKE